MTRRREAGNGVLALLLLLALAAGAGAWNYNKNVEAEDDVYRPFKGYTDQALADLTEAYETRQSGDKKRFEQVSSRRVAARERGTVGSGILGHAHRRRTGAEGPRLSGLRAAARTSRRDRSRR